MTKKQPTPKSRAPLPRAKGSRRPIKSATGPDLRRQRAVLATWAAAGLYRVGEDGPQTIAIMGELAGLLARGPRRSADVERLILGKGRSRRTYFYVRKRLRSAGALHAVREGGAGAMGHWLLQLSTVKAGKVA